MRGDPAAPPAQAAHGTPAELYYNSAAKSMGKRELLLIVGFLILGAVVYQATAPPAGPNDRSFSFTRILDHIRREMRGNRASAETTTTSTHAISRDVTEVRLDGRLAEIIIVGEERADIETSFRVHSNAYDDEEAKRTAQETILLVDRLGATVSFEPKYPDPGQQRAFLTMKVPARLRLRLDQTPSRLEITGVAAVEVPDGRFETSITRVAGPVDINHRGGSVKIEDVGSLKMSIRGSEGSLARVRGEASITVQGGELKAAELGGPVDVEASGADVTIGAADTRRGPIRINVSGGSIVVDGLQADARIDGRNSEIEVAMAAAAPLSVYSEGEERIALIPPAAGYTLDARATNGRITLPEDLRSALKVEEGDGDEQRVSGSANGGGPTITLRANHGNIAILSRESLKSQR